MVELTPSERKAYAEVEYIIYNMDPKYAEKVPDYMLEFLKRAKDETYNVQINPEIPLYMNELEEYTLDVLNVINLNYWSDDDKERRQLAELIENSAYKYKLEAIISEDKENDSNIHNDDSDASEENEEERDKFNDFTNPDDIEEMRQRVLEQRKRIEKENMEELEKTDTEEEEKKENITGLLFKNLRKLFKK